MADQTGKISAPDFTTEIRQTGQSLLDHPTDVQSAQKFLGEVQALQQNPQLLNDVQKSSQETNHTFHMPFVSVLPNLYLSFGPNGLAALDIGPDRNANDYHYDVAKMIGGVSPSYGDGMQSPDTEMNYALLKPADQTKSK